jgi:hypothetical protein
MKLLLSIIASGFIGLSKADAPTLLLFSFPNNACKSSESTVQIITPTCAPFVGRAGTPPYVTGGYNSDAAARNCTSKRCLILTIGSTNHTFAVNLYNPGDTSCYGTPMASWSDGKENWNTVQSRFGCSGESGFELSGNIKLLCV